MKTLALRACVFINCFLVRYPGETLALVVHILLHTFKVCRINNASRAMPVTLLKGGGLGPPCVSRGPNRYMTAAGVEKIFYFLGPQRKVGKFSASCRYKSCII